MNTVSIPLMARRLLGIVLIAGVVTVVVGCGHNSLVGKWQGTMPFGTMTLPMTIEFKPDGTDTRTFTAALIGTTVISDTYVVKDGTLRMTPTGMTINGKAYPMPRRVAAVQSLPMKLKGDTLTLDMAEQLDPVTLTRVKP